MAFLERPPTPAPGSSRPSGEVALRPATAADASILHPWRHQWSVRRFQPLHPMTLSQLRSDLGQQRMEDLYRARGEKFQWIILGPGEGAGRPSEPVGWITLVVGNWDHGLAEVGYTLGSRHQGRGLMARALRLLLEDLFAHTELERIEARCAVGNTASQRVLESLGFEREGLLRRYFRLHGRRVDNYLYALLKDELPEEDRPLP